MSEQQVNPLAPDAPEVAAFVAAVETPKVELEGTLAEPPVRRKPGPKKGWLAEKKAKEAAEAAGKPAVAEEKPFVDLGELKMVKAAPGADDPAGVVYLRARIEGAAPISTVSSSNRAQTIATREVEGALVVLLQPGTRALIPVGLTAADLPLGVKAYQFDPSGELLFNKGLYGAAELLFDPASDQFGVLIINLSDVRVQVTTGDLLGSLKETR